MPGPTRAKLWQVDPYLTTLSIEYANRPDGYIAKEVFPILDSEKKRTGRYRKFRGDTRFRKYDDEMPKIGHANEIDFNLDTDGTYACVDRALEVGIADKDRDEFVSQGIDLVEAGMRALTDSIMIGREYRTMSIVTNTTNMSGYYADLTVANRWDNYTSADSDPFDDVETMRASIHSSTGGQMNRLLIGRQVFDKVKHHPLVLDRIKYTMAATVNNVTPALLAQAFGVEKVLVGDPLYVTTDEGQTVSLGYIWGKIALGYYVPPTLTNECMAFGFIPSYYGGDAVVTERWRETGARGEYVRVGVDEDEVLVAAMAGYLFRAVVS